MVDDKTTLEELKSQVKKFCEDRDWDQFHSPKELAIGCITEASELLEHFRFKNDNEMKEILASKRADIGEELSDVLMFILRFAQMYNFDLSSEVAKKLKKNSERLPIEKSRGKNLKYNEY